MYLPDAEVIVLSLDDPPEVVPVLGGDEPAAPHVHHLQGVLLLYDLLARVDIILYFFSGKKHIATIVLTPLLYHTICRHLYM